MLTLFGGSHIDISEVVGVTQYNGYKHSRFVVGKPARVEVLFRCGKTLLVPYPTPENAKAARDWLVDQVNRLYAAPERRSMSHTVPPGDDDDHISS